VNQSRLRGVEPSSPRVRLPAAGPEAAIDRPEDAVSIDAAMTMRVTFAQELIELTPRQPRTPPIGETTLEPDRAANPLS
jgi:hypothetical protein